jgi:uncharacterized OsmC-like protein
MATNEPSESNLKRVNVDGRSKSPKRMAIETGGTEFVVGDDASPLDHLLAAFAGCINATGYQVADEMGIEIDALDVSVGGEYDPAVFMGEECDERAGFQEFEIEVDVESDADRETLASWLDQIEERCPVSDNLKDETPASLSLDD